MSSKFDLLFENIMDVLKDAEVNYVILHDLVLNLIAEYLDMTSEEILEQGWDVNSYIADADDIISVVNDGFENDITRAEAKKFNNKLLIVDLSKLPIDEDTYYELLDNTKLYDEILSKVKANGLHDIESVYIK